MKIRFLLLPFLMTLCSLSLSAQALDLTTEQWREDLEFLAKKLKKTSAVLPVYRKEVEKALQTLQNQLDKKSDLEIMIEMGRIVALFEQGHTELNLSQTAAGLHKVPLIFYYFGEDLHIQLAAPTHKNLLGKKIIRFDNTPTAEAFKKLKPLLSHDNEQELKYAAPNYFALTEILHFLGVIKNNHQIELTFEDGQTTTVEAVSANEYNNIQWTNARTAAGNKPPLYLQNTADFYWHTFLEDSQTFYFQFNRTNNQKGKPSIKSFTKAMFEAIDRLKPEKLVIDLRLNNGGNYRLTRPIVDAILERPWLNQKDKVFVINGMRTFSAASVFTIFLKKETNSILVGEPSRTKPNGANDNNEYATLPNSKLVLSYTNRVSDHWSAVGDALYIPVDVPLENRIEDYIQGKDRILEYILKH